MWVADIQAPIVQAKYEIITKINYQDEKLEAKEIRLITVVDPEGYVFRKSGAEETRLSGAVVSIFWQNPANNNFELWPAEKYQQANPQTTDITGRYSFLVPPGEYYIKAVLDGYASYEGERFTVKEGNNVNFNIELKANFWNFKTLDWKMILLIILTILILYNFYRDRRRNKV
ncbi:MAG: carboxypeptidase-like regulatory domain-containing protein [bacterium]